MRTVNHSDSFDAARCLVLSFVSLSMAVAGFFGFLRHHSRADGVDTRPPRGAMILGLIGILGGIIAAMATVLISDLSESG